MPFSCMMANHLIDWQNVHRHQLGQTAMSYARDEAIRIVEWALTTISAEESICAELPFLDARRKADITIMSPSRLSAIEIKGSRDNTHSLEQQITDYQNMFLDVSVATVEKHLQRVRELVPREVGILLLDPEGPRLLRKPKNRARLASHSAARWLSIADLRSLLGSKLVRELGSTSAREHATQRISANELSRFALHAVWKRNQGRFHAFINERGTSGMDLDDLQMLALQQNIRR